MYQKGVSLTFVRRLTQPGLARVLALVPRTETEGRGRIDRLRGQETAEHCVWGGGVCVVRVGVLRGWVGG